MSLNTTTKAIVRKLLASCEEAHNKIYFPVLKELNETEIKSLARYPREAGGDGEFWAGVLFPQAQSIYKYYHPDSAYNTVWKHDKIIKNLTSLVLSHREEFFKTYQINSLNIVTLRDLVNSTRETVAKQEELIAHLPLIMQAVSVTNINIQRDADYMQEIIKGLRKGIMDTQAMTKIYPDFEQLAKIEPEITRMEKFYWNTYGMHFFFDYPIHDNNVAFYKAIIFKEWLNEASYRITNGPKFAMFNRTNNCTRFLSEPRVKQLFLSCDQSNTSINSFKKHSHTKIDLTDENRIEETEPTIILTQTHRLIHCYQHNITFLNETQTCGKLPFYVPLNVSINIEGLYHSYETIEAVESISTKNSLKFDSSVNFDPWKSNYEQSLRNLANMTQENEEMRRLNLKTIVNEVENHPHVLGGTSIILILGLVAISLYCCMRKDPIVEAVQTQILANVMDNASIKSTLVPASQAPHNLTISIGNSFIRTGTSVNSPENKESLYPNLWIERLARAATPYPPSKSESSLNSSQTKELKFYPAKPLRFPGKQFQMSTLSLPAVSNQDILENPIGDSRSRGDVEK